MAALQARFATFSYGIQQPAVSGQIAKLEESLGIKLFQQRRTGNAATCKKPVELCGKLDRPASSLRFDFHLVAQFTCVLLLAGRKRAARLR